MEESRLPAGSLFFFFFARAFVRGAGGYSRRDRPGIDRLLPLAWGGKGGGEHAETGVPQYVST